MFNSMRLRVFAMVLTLALLIPTLAGAYGLPSASSEGQTRPASTQQMEGRSLYDWLLVFLEVVFGEDGETDDQEDTDDDSDVNVAVDPNG